MRNMIVVVIVALVCLMAPFGPQLGLFGYYWFAIMRPDVLAWSGANNYSFYMAAVTILFALPRILQNLPVLITNSLCRALILFVVTVSLSVVFAVSMDICLPQYGMFLRIVIMALILPLVLVTRRHLELMMVVISASIGLLAAKYGLAGVIAGGARFMAGYGGMLSDNNTMALAFCLALPLCYFIRPVVSQPWMKMGLLACSFLSIGGVFFTHSRGGVVSVMVCLLLILLKSKRRVMMGLVLLGCTGGITYLVKDTLLKRMETVATVGSSDAESSAQSRLVLSAAAIRMWMDYPLFGVGFTEKNEQALIGKYLQGEDKAHAGKVIHNTYTQLLADTGIFALIIYLYLLFGTIMKMRAAGRRARQRGDDAAAGICDAILTALITYAVGSTFLSRTTFDFFYMLVMTAATYLTLEQREGFFTPVVAPAPAEASGFTTIPAMDARPTAPVGAGPLVSPGRMRMTRPRLRPRG
ncbi:MAG: putative O-glycosylation ligase, exosortase A system-associated [Acidobacteria bacterium]|nr:putative O-glycosylation ligase, exosortase A system-associated [Acidobacteriota bacterium]